ncbi:uncharacterized protein LOC123869515 isoform X2 [Maniola jurtina]|uniref:uncharacterized protein LOC123869515 isoform X2 n=1 Tax=Maniola jurtina TaxID=191418 RepID=UPI001E6875AC|nr:uncharacterized protein LOC123869515 isoform X2 [Maniola jurtina]
MECVMFFVFLVVVLCSNVSYAQLEDECYFAMFNKGTEPCSDFENERLICSLDIEIVPKSDDEDGGIMLTGEMDIKEDLGEEYEIELNVWKEVGSTKEYMYSIEGNLCDSLKMNNTPWKPFVEALQTTDCPVLKGVYKVDKLRMSLDFAKPFMKSEFCGNYVVDMSMRQISDKMSCYEIGLEIEEGSC